MDAHAYWCERCESWRVRIERAQATGARHSRTIEKRIAAAKSAKVSRFLLIPPIIARRNFGVAAENPSPQGTQRFTG
jgi:hypothetical protein